MGLFRVAAAVLGLCVWAAGTVHAAGQPARGASDAHGACGNVGRATPGAPLPTDRRVADDESRHLSWCIQRLRELGHDYGAMPAHNLLWEGCQLSADDLGARLAVVPMSQVRRPAVAGGGHVC